MPPQQTSKGFVSYIRHKRKCMILMGLVTINKEGNMNHFSVESRREAITTAERGRKKYAISATSCFVSHSSVVHVSSVGCLLPQVRSQTQ